MDKVKTFVKSIPHRVKEYLKKYFKTLNYPLWILSILVMIGLFLADYFSKINAFYYLTNGDASNPILIQEHQGTTIIPGILNLQFTINNGAAGGMLSGSMWLLTILSFIASFMLVFNVLFRFTRYNWVLMVGVILMAPGAAGNLVDRVGCLANAGIYQHGVIDFLQFSFWKSFPICNLADYWLSVGVVFLIIGFVIEFKKEYKLLKEEEEKEKALAAQAADTNHSTDEELKKKLQEKDALMDSNATQEVKEAEDKHDSESK